MRPLALASCRGLFVLIFASAPLCADVFRLPAGRKSLEFVTVGDPGNASDERTGFGSVKYRYQIAKYPVTAVQYCEFLNAVARTDTYGLYYRKMEVGWPMACCISRDGQLGRYHYTVTRTMDDQPVSNVAWGSAVRFVNWLSNGQPSGDQSTATTEDGSYAVSGKNSHAELMRVARKAGAQYVLPTEDEWYKAAYYRGGSANAGYWDYPTRTNTAPSRSRSRTSTNHANYFVRGAKIDSGDIDNPKVGPTPVREFAGSTGPYGTFDQGGNVWQWLETAVTPDTRGVRGGSFGGSVCYLLATYRDPGNSPCERDCVIGFRVVLLTALGARTDKRERRRKRDRSD
jgi:formylglycine-generating enzyme required for sulfatase activity